jgi:hypothetical protein
LAPPNERESPRRQAPKVRLVIVNSATSHPNFPVKGNPVPRGVPGKQPRQVPPSEVPLSRPASLCQLCDCFSVTPRSPKQTSFLEVCSLWSPPLPRLSPRSFISASSCPARRSAQPARRYWRRGVREMAQVSAWHAPQRPVGPYEARVPAPAPRDRSQLPKWMAKLGG